MAQQLGDIHNDTVVAGLDILCSYLPPDYDSKCSLFMHIFGPIALRLLDSGASPDKICYDTTLCVDQTGKGMCHLFPFTDGIQVNMSYIVLYKTTYSRLVKYFMHYQQE